MRTSVRSPPRPPSRRMTEAHERRQSLQSLERGLAEYVDFLESLPSEGPLVASR